MSEIQTAWEWNGVSLMIDLQDEDFAAALEAGRESLAKTRLPKTDSLAEILHAECEAYRAFFDALFGAGTSERLFGKKNHRGKILDAFESFSDFCMQQQLQINERESRLLAKYSPNRAQRRAK